VLPLTKLRARTDEDKQVRRDAILRATRQVLTRITIAEITIDEVAREANLGKASVFRYFATKDALLLAVYEAELLATLESLRVAVSSNPGLPTPDVARSVVTIFRERPLFMPLAAIVHVVMERNVDLETMLAFKRNVLAHLVTTAATLEEHLAFVRPGQGVPLIIRTHAILVGLFHLAEAPSVCAEALRAEDLQALKLDFAIEAERTLALFFRGMEPNR